MSRTESWLRSPRKIAEKGTEITFQSTDPAFLAIPTDFFYTKQKFAFQNLVGWLVAGLRDHQCIKCWSYRSWWSTPESRSSYWRLLGWTKSESQTTLEHWNHWNTRLNSWDIHNNSLQVQRFSKTRSFVKDQVLLDLFVRLKFSHLPTCLTLTTCYNHLSPGKLGPWRFTVLSR